MHFMEWLLLICVEIAVKLTRFQLHVKLKRMHGKIYKTMLSIFTVKFLQSVQIRLLIFFQLLIFLLCAMLSISFLVCYYLTLGEIDHCKIWFTSLITYQDMIRVIISALPRFRQKYWTNLAEIHIYVEDSFGLEFIRFWQCSHHFHCHNGNIQKFWRALYHCFTLIFYTIYTHYHS